MQVSLSLILVFIDNFHWKIYLWIRNKNYIYLYMKLEENRSITPQRIDILAINSKSDQSEIPKKKDISPLQRTNGGLSGDQQITRRKRADNSFSPRR